MPQVLGAQYAWRTAVFGEGRPRIALQPGALPHDSKSWRRIAVSRGTRPGDHAPGQPALALWPGLGDQRPRQQPPQEVARRWPAREERRAFLIFFRKNPNRNPSPIRAFRLFVRFRIQRLPKPSRPKDTGRTWILFLAQVLFMKNLLKPLLLLAVAIHAGPALSNTCAWHESVPAASYAVPPLPSSLNLNKAAIGGVLAKSILNVSAITASYSCQRGAKVNFSAKVDNFPYENGKIFATNVEGVGVRM